MPDLHVELEIGRPVADVRAWWLDFPADYRATDPREQPYRIVTRERTPDTIDVMTYWRLPGGVRTTIPERFLISSDGWTVDLDLPLGLKQRDRFHVSPAGDHTRVTIDVTIEASGWRRLLRPFFVAYGRAWYPRTWRAAAKLCERDAPRMA